MSDANIKRWTAIARELLEGRKIVAVRYLTKGEQADLGWDRSCVVMQLDDGNIIYPSRDDEGNEPGALFSNSAKTPLIPVI